MPQEVIALLKSIPGGAKALARVIGAPVSALSAWVDIATAKGERHSRDIRAQTVAREKIIAAMGSEAVKQIEDDHGLAQRALEAFAGDLLAKQVNREAVAAKAIGHLRDGSPSTHSGEVAADWLNIFSSFAERASSDRLREHWASVLAGEIRRPGAVSLATLNLLSLVDEEIASLITTYSSFCYEDPGGSRGLFIEGDFARSPRYDDLLSLDAANFLTLGHGIDLKLVYIGDYAINLKENEDLGSPQLGTAILTKAGKEIVDLVGQRPSKSDAEFVFEQLNPNAKIRVQLIKR